MQLDNNDAIETPEAAVARITKLAETDPKAADAALQRFARAREAREAEEEAKIISDEEINVWLGKLELGASEPDTKGIEHIDLDGSLDDAPVDRVEPENAEPPAAKQDTEAKIDAGEPAASFDDVIRIAKTEGPEAAAAALWRWRRTREAHEALSQLAARRDERERFESFERIWRDEPADVWSVAKSPSSTIPIPAKPETPLEVPAEPSEVVPPVAEPDFFEIVPLRSTRRKAGRFLPNCFGSQFLRDPESTDCRPCAFSDSCKSTAADEELLLKAERDARKERYLKAGGVLAGPKKMEFLRRLLRGHHLNEYRRALKERQRNDRDYQRDKRANPTAEVLIARELSKRLAALHSAIARPGGNKFLEQLRGREAMIGAVWEAEQLARINHGAAASAAHVAEAFNQMIGYDDALSKHQVRSYRINFKKLEKLPQAWKRFVKPPDDETA